MRVLRGEHFEFRIPTRELKVTPAQVADFSLQPADLRLELSDLLGEGVDGALLLGRLDCVSSIVGEGFAGRILPLRKNSLWYIRGTMASEKMLTTGEVAGRLGVSLRRVRQLIEEGRLPSRQFGRDHLINESDLKLVEDRRPGRPSKKASEEGSKK